MPIHLDQGADITAFAIEEAIVGIGDEAIAMTLDRDPDHDCIEVMHTAAVLFRSGAVVADIRLTRVYDPPSLSAAKALAATQAACLTTGDCLLPPQTPGSLNGIKGIEAEESPASAKM